MLKRVTFKRDYRCFKQGETISFEPLTLLVGDQGCGKSTVLQLLTNAGRKDASEIISIEATPIATRAFDYEKDSPRKGDVFTRTDVFSRMVSHGEFVRKLNESICEQKGVCWLQDEPDASLSIRSCLKLAEDIKTALANGCQVIAAVHAVTLIQQFKRVFSLEDRSWMTPDEFIQRQLRNAPPKSRK